MTNNTLERHSAASPASPTTATLAPTNGHAVKTRTGRAPIDYNYETPAVFWITLLIFSLVPVCYFIELDPVWDWAQAVEFSVRYWWLYAFTGAIYLPLVFWLIQWMKNKKPYNLRTPLIVHNIILTLFNLVVVCYTVPLIFNYYNNYGWRDLLCTNGVLREGGEGGRMIFLFGLAKIPELLDTVFLILRKRPVILLHWYHHWSVMLFCWHVTFAYNNNSGGEASMFAGMNAFIHVIMYAYYGAMAMRIKLASWMPLFITVMQITQMVFGIILETNKFVTCVDCQYLSGVYIGMFMYISYFVLFSLYFLNRYVRKGEGKVAMD